MKIGVKNFRIFKEYTEFDIRPITILTGPNSSGKSSFTKLLLLLKSNLNYLDFSTGEHHLKDFKTSLTFKSEKNTLEVSLIDYESEILDLEYGLSPDGSNADLLKVTNRKDGFEFEFKNSGHDTVISFDVDELIAASYAIINKKIRSSKSNSRLLTHIKENIDILKNESLLDAIDRIFQEGVLIKAKNPKFQKTCNDSIRSILSESLTLILNSTAEHVLGKPVTYTSMEELNNLASMTLYSLDFSEILYTDLENLISKKLDKTVSLESTSLYHLIFKLILVDEKDEFTGRSTYQATCFKQLIRTVFNPKYFSDLYHISPHRGSHERIYNDNDQKENIYKEYLKANSPNLEFIKKSFEILGFDYNWELERLENRATKINLRDEFNEFSLSDIGFGFSQILPVIFKIAIMGEFKMDFNPKYLIIEEPESNLHPNLQSKLAEIFVLAINTLSNLNLIIETHSEYLIRRLQYLTAKKEIETGKSVIYYFNADKNASLIEPKVKEIEILENGNLSDSFGEGFYDESTKLKFDLAKLNRIQYN